MEIAVCPCKAFFSTAFSLALSISVLKQQTVWLFFLSMYLSVCRLSDIECDNIFVRIESSLLFRNRLNGTTIFKKKILLCSTTRHISHNYSCAICTLSKCNVLWVFACDIAPVMIITANQTNQSSKAHWIFFFKTLEIIFFFQFQQTKTLVATPATNKFS